MKMRSQLQPGWLRNDGHSRTVVLVAISVAILAATGFGMSWPVAVMAGSAGGIVGYAIARAAARGRPSDRSVPSGRGLQRDEVTAGEAVRALIGIVDVPALVIDQDGRVLCHNRPALELFANLDDGRPLFQVSRSPGLHETVARAQRQGLAQTGEMSDLAAGGRRLLATVSPLRLPSVSRDGEATSLAPVMLIQFRDLSEQDRLAQLRSDFIANASHELRTPLASLKGFIETLQGPASGDQAAKIRFLGIMEAQAARMTRILDDLLFLSRVEMLAHVPLEDDVDLDDAVQSAVQGLEPIAGEAKITLSYPALTDAAHVRGDRDQLEQVFQNLIQNAIKYGTPGGTVEVTVGRRSAAGQPDQFAVAVRDDGPGIAEEHLPRLTERFYRVDTATSREKGGTGLGLAIVKHILNRHRGDLEITSRVGAGSTFTVVLPAVLVADVADGRQHERRSRRWEHLLNDIKE